MKQLSALGEGDVLFLAGSIPSSMADDAYQKIMEMLDSKGIRIVVDATRDLLMKVLPYHLFSSNRTITNSARFSVWN